MRTERSFHCLSAAAVRAGIPTWVISVFISALIPSAGWAESEGSSGTEGPLAEVLVTAQKRSESLQEVPVAVTAIGADSLGDMHITSIGDLMNVAPNVQLEQNFVYGRSTAFTIRGLGLIDGQASFDPPVGVVIDGVFVNRTTGAVIDAFDLQQLEILRGPQGTLFGKNSTGGIVSMTSKRPSGAFGAGAEVRLGNYNRRDLKGYVELPISDRLATRISAVATTRDGYATNVRTGKDQDAEDVRTFRAVTTLGGERFDGLLTLEYSQDRSGSSGMENMSDHTGFLVCNVLGQCGGGDVRAIDVSVEPSDFDISTAFATATLNWSIGSQTLTSVTGYRKLDIDRQPLDADGSRFQILDVLRFEDTDQISQEFRLASDTDGRLDYVAGVYYFRQKYDFDQKLFVGDLLGPVIPPLITFPLYNYVVGESESYAAFAQLDFRLSDRWGAAIGGRYTEEEKKARGTYQFDPARLGDQIAHLTGGPRPAPDYDLERSTSNFSPKASLTFRPMSDVLLYGSFTRGFKSGGFSDRATRGAGQLPFDDEQVDSFEIGLKSELFDRTVRLNAAVFDMDYKDIQTEIQVAVPGGGVGTATLNASDASIRGLEVEASWIPTDGLTFDFSFGYLDAEYGSFCGVVLRGLHGDPVGPGQVTAQCVAETGTSGATQNNDLEFRNAPKTTWTLGANYVRDLPSGGSLVLDAQAFHTSEQYTNLTNDILGLRPDVTVYDASIAWRSPDDRWSVSVYGRNLGDETYAQSYSNAGNLAGLSVFQPPRTYGLQFGARFGK